MPNRLEIKASRTSSGISLNPWRVLENCPVGSANTSPLVAAARVDSASISHSCGAVCAGAVRYPVIDSKKSPMRNTPSRRLAPCARGVTGKSGASIGVVIASATSEDAAPDLAVAASSVAVPGVGAFAASGMMVEPAPAEGNAPEASDLACASNVTRPCASTLNLRGSAS